MDLCVCVRTYMHSCRVNTMYVAGQALQPLTVTLHPSVCGVQQAHCLNFIQVHTICVCMHILHVCMHMRMLFNKCQLMSSRLYTCAHTYIVESVTFNCRHFNLS